MLQYDRPRVSTIFMDWLVTYNLNNGPGKHITLGISSSCVTAEDVRPCTFAQCAKSQSHCELKGAQTVSTCMSSCDSWFNDLCTIPGMGAPALLCGNWSMMTVVDVISELPASISLASSSGSCGTSGNLSRMVWSWIAAQEGSILWVSFSYTSASVTLVGSRLWFVLSSNPGVSSSAKGP